MNRIAIRDAAPPRELWRSVPLECYASAALVILAAGLKHCGAMP